MATKGPSKSASRGKFLQGQKTIKDAAKAWGVTKTYVYALIRTGKLAAKAGKNGDLYVTGKLPARRTGNQYTARKTAKAA